MNGSIGGLLLVILVLSTGCLGQEEDPRGVGAEDPEMGGITPTNNATSFPPPTADAGTDRASTPEGPLYTHTTRYYAGAQVAAPCITDCPKRIGATADEQVPGWGLRETSFETIQAKATGWTVTFNWNATQPTASAIDAVISATDEAGAERALMVMTGESPLVFELSLDDLHGRWTYGFHAYPVVPGFFLQQEIEISIEIR